MKLRSLNCKFSTAVVDGDCRNNIDDDEMAANISAVAAIQQSMSVKPWNNHEVTSLRGKNSLDGDDQLLSFNLHHNEEEQPHRPKRRYSFPSSCTASLGSLDDDDDKSFVRTTQDAHPQVDHKKNMPGSLNLYDRSEEMPVPPIPRVIDTTILTSASAALMQTKSGKNRRRLSVTQCLVPHRRHPTVKKVHKTTKQRLHAMS